jgi:choline dehydrogenase-like flavoprotein
MPFDAEDRPPSTRASRRPAHAIFDYDWLVIGSGFGGSVSALRLAERGYRVGVLECGRRYRDEDFAKTTWELARYYWPRPCISSRAPGWPGRGNVRLSRENAGYEAHVLDPGGITHMVQREGLC